MRTQPNLPPGPKGTFFLGSARDLQHDPLDFLMRLAQEYGDAAVFRIGQRQIFQFNHPDFVRDILVTHHRHLRKTGLMKQAKPILGQGLFLSEGELHRRQRRVIQPAFQRDRIATHATAITEAAAQLRDKWRDGQVLDISQEMLDLTLPIVAQTLFNIDIRHETSDIKAAFHVVLERFNRFLRPSTGFFSLLPSARNRRFHRSLALLERIVYRMIDECRKEPSRQANVISMLLLAEDRDGNRIEMNDTQIRDEVLTLLVAGHETVATALTWTWYLLSQNPVAERHFHEELDRVLQGRLPTAIDVPNLKYTEMILAESMRLYPPVWALSRQVVSDLKIGPYLLPAGSTVGISQYVAHRDPRFFPEPEEFDPLRWTPDKKASRPKYCYFPFGGGPRLCVGEPLAWFEGVLLLAALGQHCQLQLEDAHEVTLQPLVTLRPRNGIPMIVKRRKPSTASENTERASSYDAL